MTTYIVTCETCLYRSMYPTHDAATTAAQVHAEDYADHSVTVTQEEDDEGTLV